MGSQRILDHLAEYNAVLTNSHFVYTKGGHGTAYINMREVAHHSRWLSSVAEELAQRLYPHNPQLIIGPETLGRSLAEATGRALPAFGIWCDVTDVDGQKSASFKDKLDFGRLVEGQRVAVVDDLLTTGSSVKATSQLITSLGGEVVVAGVVVRRSPEVTAFDCGAAELEVLADVEGFALFTEEECRDHGPCSRMVPMRLRPGHGWKWAESHPDYPTV